ncbi:PREDICTED: uncharacterized protein LOC109126472 [Camelina sativa]|uniref:Uncharacterized protein LOC109126472 n=1 Tax=Camelina sativa TaxID=90675 RepID=A0ABM1QFP4_CAMSA|nr:PREDICTED: uncharacterized protein LOC109126472 [Camelina sativa]
MPPEALPPGDVGSSRPVTEKDRVEMEEGEICQVGEGLAVQSVVSPPQTVEATVEKGLSVEVVPGVVDQHKVTVNPVKLGGQSKQRTWVSMVKESDVMEKVELDVEDIDGMPTVRIPDAVFDEAQPLWEDFLIGKFLAKAPFVGGIHALVNKIWTLGDKTMKIDVYAVDNTTVRFRIKDERTRQRVLRRGMWNLCGVAVVLTKWTPIIDTTQEGLTTVPMWVVVKNVPPRYFSWKVLSAITSPLGTPKRLHPETEACKLFVEAKVFVEVDLTKSLPKHMSFKSGKGGDTVVEFVYPWLPPRCVDCSKWGHLRVDCLSKKNLVTPALVPQGLVDDASPAIAADLQSNSENVAEIVRVGDNVADGAVNSDQSTDAEWCTPIKGIRSPGKIATPSNNEISNLSNSFSCLSDKGEKGEDISSEPSLTEAGAECMKESTADEPDQEKQARKDTDTILDQQGVLLRPSLPRASKEGHKYVSVTGQQKRKSLWSDLQHHHHSPLFRNKAWLICGDFNETLDGDDHSLSDSSPSVTLGMRDFQNLARDCELVDMSYQGPRFTWGNKRHDGVICKKLDRVLRKVQKPFKFVNTVATHPDYQTTLADIWKRSPPLFHSTSAMHRFTKSLKGLKPHIRRLGKQMVSNITARTKAAYEALCEAQRRTMVTPSSQAVHEEATKYDQWRTLANIEERFLQQKAKLHWLWIGDQNNKAFHAAAKLREVRNNIKEIQCEDGRSVHTQEHIKLEAEQYFTNFLNFTPADYVDWSTQELAQILNYKCDENDKSLLTREVTREEIKRVLFAMPVNKSPGPDGFNVEFFKESWSIVGDDCVVAVQSFFQNGFLPKGVNSTILALIPKKKDAQTMKDYRPISCCNVLYKIISKILANRLKLILPKFISPNQSAFVKDRLLMENLLLATELVKDYHKDSVSPRCAMKIDISKAFDSVQWSFLINTLRALDFPDTYIHWIQTCITSASFSVQVNGELAGYFGSKWGLRQGCSLSPYLFVICMNVLSRKLDIAAQNKQFGLHPHCRSMNLTHLCFADDLMVFVEGRKQSIEGALDVFSDFAKHSGRLQLFQSVTFSLINFWIAAFRLQKACVKEIDKLCSAFLWAGPSLNPKKAKVPWSDVCLPKHEGGLGLRSIEEANKVCVLKLIWRILSAKDSLWENWVKRHLVRSGSLWAEQEPLTPGSWIWRKLLKYRTIATQMYKVDVYNGETTSFWFDNWSDLGCLYDKLGNRGTISLGIPLTSTVAEVMEMNRQRRHRQPLLSQIEEVIRTHKLERVAEVQDVALWKGKNDSYHKKFSTKDTWSLIRVPHPPMEVYKVIWFKYATPRFAFLTWLLAKDRLTTGDKLQR